MEFNNCQTLYWKRVDEVLRARPNIQEIPLFPLNCVQESKVLEKPKEVLGKIQNIALGPVRIVGESKAKDQTRTR